MSFVKSHDQDTMSYGHFTSVPLFKGTQSKFKPRSATSGQRSVLV